MNPQATAIAGEWSQGCILQEHLHCVRKQIPRHASRHQAAPVPSYHSRPVEHAARLPMLPKEPCNPTQPCSLTRRLHMQGKTDIVFTQTHTQGCISSTYKHTPDSPCHFLPPPHNHHTENLPTMLNATPSLGPAQCFKRTLATTATQCTAPVCGYPFCPAVRHCCRFSEMLDSERPEQLHQFMQTPP